MKFDDNPKKPRPEQDLTGKHFQDWHVIEFVGRIKYVPFYKALCKCGSEAIIRQSDLSNGKTKRCRSCGNIERYKKVPNTNIGPQAVNWQGTKDIPKAQFTKFKYGAQVRKIPFEITIKYMQELWDKQKGKCSYTGRSLVFNNKRLKIKARKGEIFNFASLDRIDSNRGYVVGNVQWVVQAVNIAKQEYFHEEFLNLVKEIYEHLDLGNKVD